MKLPLFKKFQQLDSVLTQGDFETAELLLRDLHRNNLPSAARLLFDELNRKFSLSSGINIQFESSFTLPKTEPERPDGMLSSYDDRPVLDGISIVSCCMNRNENLKTSLKSWLKLPVHEIVIVDWNSDEPVSLIISDIPDQRIKVIRIENQPEWILTYGFNIGLRFASYAKIYKLDADIQVAPDFIEQNSFEEHEFIRGNWESAIQHKREDQRYVNGSFGAHKKDLLDIGFYNEFIRTYGWDDSDLYNRLALEQGLRRKYLVFGSLTHMDQDQEDRLRHQNVANGTFLDRYPATEFTNSCNKFTVALFNHWDKSFLQDYSIKQISDNSWFCQRTTNHQAIPNSVHSDAVRYAVTEILSWINPAWTQNIYNEPWMAGLIYDQYVNETPFLETSSILLFESNFDILLCKSPNPFEVINESQKNISGKESSRRKPLYIFKGKNARFELNINNEKIILQCLEGSLFKRIENLHENHKCLKTFPDPDISLTSPETSNRKRILAISLYDESNKDRASEYLECIYRNMAHFDAIAIFYEKSNGSVYDLVNNSITTHRSKSKTQIIWFYTDSRPTFDSIFRAVDFIFPDTIAFVANADITFDTTINNINEVITENSFFVLSRNEVEPKSGTSDRLVMNYFGLPNTLSADVWIYMTPRKFKFRADFAVGTFHCDSFLNYHIHKSGYQLYNPCLSVNALHVHDPAFNSSETKKSVLAKQIDEVLVQETTLCGGEVPIRGVQWCRLKDVAVHERANQMITWSNFIINIFVGAEGKSLVSSLAIAAMSLKLARHIEGGISVSLNIPAETADTRLGDLLFDALQVFDNSHLNIAITNPGDQRPFVDGPETCHKAAPDIKSLVNTYLASFTENDEVALFDTDIKFSEVGGRRIITFPPHISVYFSGHQYNDLTTYLILRSLKTEEFDLLHRLFTTLGPQYKNLMPFADEFRPARQNREECAAPDLFNELWSPIPMGKPNLFEITFITSIYKGADFFRAFLENIAACAIECNAEIILVDAASPENEKEIFTDFLEEYPGLNRRFKYISLEHDPGLYNCWKLAIEQSSSEFVGNANLDDRRSPYQAAALLDIIRNDPKLSGAATALRATEVKNAPWYSMTEDDYWFKDEDSNKIEFESLYARNESDDIYSRNIMHCMPVWRKSLHQKYGFFDEDRYGTSADWAFWLECTKNGETFQHIPSLLSMYLISETSHNRTKDVDGKKELKIIKDYINSAQQYFIPQ